MPRWNPSLVHFPAGLVLAAALVLGSAARGADLVAKVFSEHGAPILLLPAHAPAAEQAHEMCREFGFPDGAARFAVRNLTAEALSGTGMVVFNRSTRCFELKKFDKEVSAFIMRCPAAALDALGRFQATPDASAFPRDAFARLMAVLPDEPEPAEGISRKEYLNHLYLKWTDPEAMGDILAAVIDPTGASRFDDFRALLDELRETAAFAFPDASGTGPNGFRVFAELDAREHAGEFKAPAGGAAAARPDPPRVEAGGAATGVPAEPEKSYFEQVFFHELKKPLGWAHWLTDHLALSNFDDPRRRVELVSGPHPHAKP